MTQVKAHCLADLASASTDYLVATDRWSRLLDVLQPPPPHGHEAAAVRPIFLHSE